MEEVYVVRHRHLVERVPIRRLSREMGIPRNTIRRYLRGAAPGVGKPRGIAGKPVLDAVRPRAEAILAESSKWTAGKQRLTAARLHTLLRGEGHEVGYTLVKEIVHEWKRRKQEVFVPLVYGQQPNMVYASAPGIGGNSLLGRMTTGQLIGLLAEVFATLMPLPAQPVATSDAGTDVGNLILFQGSLAQYAKRDEQIRTLGNLVTKLVG